MKAKEKLKEIQKGIRFSIRNKILMLLFVVALPCLGLAIYLLVSIHNYSTVYGKIVDEMAIANNYNITFKEKMDESMYKMVVGYTNSDIAKEDLVWEDPFELIDNLRQDFSALQRVTQSQESQIWLERLLQNADNLEKQIRMIESNSKTMGQYHENLEELDNNIYILTELIQEDIQYYIYYQTKSIDFTNQKLNEEINDFLIICSLLFVVLLLFLVPHA